MLNPFKGLGDFNKMRQQASKMQAALQKKEVTVEKDGVKVVVRGDQQLTLVEVDGKSEERIARAINEAVRKTQELAARKLMELSREDK